MDWLSDHIWDVIFGLTTFFVTIVWQHAGDRASKSKAERMEEANAEDLEEANAEDIEGRE